MAELYVVSAIAFSWLGWMAIGVYRRPNLPPPALVVWELDRIAHHWQELSDGKRGIGVEVSGFNGAPAVVTAMRAGQTGRCVAVLAPQNDPFNAVCVGVFVHRQHVGWLRRPDAEALRSRLVCMGIADASTSCTADIKQIALRNGSHGYVMQLVAAPFV